MIEEMAVEGLTLEESVRALEDAIRPLGYERGYIITEDGRVRQEATGSGVDVYMHLAGMQIGEVSLHNHPKSGWSPPSPGDWQMMLENPVGEMRIVSEDWTYILKAPIGGWKKGQRCREYWTGEKLRFSVRLPDMLKMVPAKIETMLPHWYSEEQRRTEGSEMMHQAWSALARETGAEYRRVRVQR
jgi:hypothetical protein